MIYSTHMDFIIQLQENKKNFEPSKNLNWKEPFDQKIVTSSASVLMKMIFIIVKNQTYI